MSATRQNPLDVLVTGAAGFIGSHVCEALLKRGDKVIGLDSFDFFYDPAVKRRNLGKCLSHPSFTLVEGDIRDLELLHRVITESLGAVIHLAARAGVRPSIEDPLLYQDVNVRGTVCLLEALRPYPECKIIFGSSSSVYGNNAKVPFSESDPVNDPQSPYAGTKRAGELLCRTYHNLFHMPITCLRFFTVYGPRQRPDLAIHKFVRLIESGEPTPIFGDGSMSRDFTYIDDIVAGVLRALNRCAGFAIYNLGGSSPVSVLELVRLIEKATGKQARIEHKPLQPGDVKQTYADLTLSRQALDFSPGTDIQTGLRRFVEWFRGQG